MAINYVKFLRGTPTAFAKLSQKDNDTLYFISESSSKRGSLYLGDKLISESVANLEDLNNILIKENLQDNHVLSYDAGSEKWVNKPVIDAIGIMTGATSTAQGGVGLVPAPGIGQDGLFLRGDGVWAMPVGGGSNVDVKPDEKTISLSGDGVTIALKDFGTKYYKFIPEANGVKAHYEAQIVDASNPWKAGLEARVTVDDNGQFVLGWFEEDSAVKGLIEQLNSRVNQVEVLTKNTAVQVEAINSNVKNLATMLNGKVNATDVYTKAEVDTKILEAGHLSRKTFSSLEEAKIFANSISNPEAYVYMVASGENAEDNKYTEYLYIEGNLELVGTWKVDLSGYATKEEVKAVDIKINTVNSKVSNLEEFLNSDYFKGLDALKDDVSEIRECVTWKEL